MSRFRFPPAMCRRTSISRSVRASSPRCSASWAANSGGIRFFPGVDLANRLDQIFRRHALEQVAARAGFERALDFNVAFKSCQHDDAGFGEFSPNRDQARRCR